jgi:hypothetical protein
VRAAAKVVRKAEVRVGVSAAAGGVDAAASGVGRTGERRVG